MREDHYLIDEEAFDKAFKKHPRKPSDPDELTKVHLERLKADKEYQEVSAKCNEIQMNISDQVDAIVGLTEAETDLLTHNRYVVNPEYKKLAMKKSKIYDRLMEVALEEMQQIGRLLGVRDSPIVEIGGVTYYWCVASALKAERKPLIEWLKANKVPYIKRPEVEM